MPPEKSSRFKTLMAVIGNKGDSATDSVDTVSVPMEEQTSRPQAEAQAATLNSAPKIVWVDRSKINRDPSQARRYFDPDELEKMAKSMKAVGIIDPLSIRPRPDSNEYDLLAGEKRHRSAEIAELTQVPCRIFEVDDFTAEDIKAISNLQRGDLNKWEETNAIMGMLCRNLQKSPEEVVSILNRASNQKRGLTDNVVRSEEWSIIEDVFDVVGRLTPESFRKHRVPLLRLPEPIQEILQQGRLSYTKVNEVLKIKDPVRQKQLLDEAVKHNLSVDTIQQKVKSLRQRHQQDDVPEAISTKLMAVVKAIKKTKIWKDPKKSARLEKLLQEIETLLS
ncbi:MULTISPECIES: ParB/RepB/Spo0J family partition protein [unclassified Leptolyngbya]|uniref:ParB/RepB/Spo0J family partition protein n=1 Tax=unclassified Leptolyngbya TaxID=2650499 RepID=UPI00168A192B|nr:MULTISPECIES: ParB/RepB/Spo0J family partition protein [unclassified Leptolyngbya]MBD1909836.1 ParB/RepB/Spo0J family partition protein [Leptolyngbya sp. FACHB-8]MBD2158987.1 ParB/RepB/Spo0J family partition protein [Leptolyngbya sp. FACHB-16]